MILHIEDQMTVADLQERFTECFPHLSIEFFDHPHHFKKTSPEIQRISPDKQVESIRHVHSPGDLVIQSAYTAGKIERDFEKLFGLHVQVCRKEKNTWSQTGKLDTMSLQTLSKMSEPYKS